MFFLPGLGLGPDLVSTLGLFILRKACCRLSAVSCYEGVKVVAETHLLVLAVAWFVGPALPSPQMPVGVGECPKLVPGPCLLTLVCIAFSRGPHTRGLEAEERLSCHPGPTSVSAPGQAPGCVDLLGPQLQGTLSSLVCQWVPCTKLFRAHQAVCSPGWCPSWRTETGQLGVTGWRWRRPRPSWPLFSAHFGQGVRCLFSSKDGAVRLWLRTSSLCR